MSLLPLLRPTDEEIARARARGSRVINPRLLGDRRYVQL